MELYEGITVTEGPSARRQVEEQAEMVVSTQQRVVSTERKRVLTRAEDGQALRARMAI